MSSAHLYIKNLFSPGLEIEHFQVHGGEAWCLVGSNQSGIDRFLELLSGDFTELHSAQVTLPTSPALVTFSKQQELYENELKNDETDFIGTIDPGTPAGHFLSGERDISALIDALGMRPLLTNGYKLLSTGESRKLMILQALATDSDFLIVQNPYDGLDSLSCKELDKAIKTIIDHQTPVMVTVNNSSDIPTWCTHIASFEGKVLSRQGKKRDINRGFQTNLPRGTPLFSAAPEPEIDLDENTATSKELINLKNGFAAYGETLLFSHLSFAILEGQHTLVTGPNGSGKSTLLQIITGDNQKCYANDLKIFGRKRGTGESIWDIKKQMGIVSTDLHRNYYIPGNALQVVISGLFDSIGVYRKFTKTHRDKALKWLSFIGLNQRATHPFKKLPYSEQRLVLIARSLIKMPRLLILDEPTHGLDEQSRKALLTFLRKISKKQLSTIIYASHREDEYCDFFQQHVQLGTSPSILYKTRVTN